MALSAHEAKVLIRRLDNPEAECRSLETALTRIRMDLVRAYGLYGLHGEPTSLEQERAAEAARRET